mmetsp:Transcript_112983/g.319579  ORF Transcript_112983/g.319579 Transcript_112983/m.319579 type:complete len:295 (+) Transcript_112983:1254-2138(+)
MVLLLRQRCSGLRELAARLREAQGRAVADAVQSSCAGQASDEGAKEGRSREPQQHRGPGLQTFVRFFVALIPLVLRLLAASALMMRLPGLYLLVCGVVETRLLEGGRNRGPHSAATLWWPSGATYSGTRGSVRDIAHSYGGTPPSHVNDGICLAQEGGRNPGRRCREARLRAHMMDAAKPADGRARCGLLQERRHGRPRWPAARGATGSAADGGRIRCQRPLQMVRMGAAAHKVAAACRATPKALARSAAFVRRTRRWARGREHLVQQVVPEARPEHGGRRRAPRWRCEGLRSF